MTDNSINTYNNPKNPLRYEVRTVQKDGHSLTLILPKSYCDKLGVQAGDLMKFRLHKVDYTGMDGILIEKIDLGSGE